METLQFLDWQISINKTKTKEIYNNIDLSGPKICGCTYCLNFSSIREKIYPPEFISLLERLGINFEKEAEVYHIHKMEDDKHLYGGWFHFVGDIVKNNISKESINNKKIKDESNTSPLVNGFEVGFTDKLELVNSEFKEYPVVQLEFITHAPWVLNNNLNS